MIGDNESFYVIIERDDVIERFGELEDAVRGAETLAAGHGEGFEYFVLKAISRHKAEKPQVTSEELK